MTADPKPRRTHCKRGHELTPQNTYTRSRGGVECRTCINAKRPKPINHILTCVDCGETRTGIYYPAQVKDMLRCRSCAVKHAYAKRGSTARDVTCPCGTVFRVKSRRSTTARYCSIPCRKKYDTYEGFGDREGEKNPNFKHGKRRDLHSRSFTLAKKGETCCRNCGAAGLRLHLHHVIPRSKFRAGKAEILNGIPLCQPCHFGWHYKKVTIYRSVFTDAEWAYLTSVQLTGENIEAWLDKHYPAPPTIDEILTHVRGKVDAARERAGLPLWEDAA